MFYEYLSNIILNDGMISTRKDSDIFEEVPFDVLMNNQSDAENKNTRFLTPVA